MGSSNRSVIVAVAVAALVVVLAGIAFIRPSAIGLGDDEIAEFVLVPLPTDDSAVTDAAIEDTIGVIEARADAFGIEVDVGREGEDVVVGVSEGDGPDEVIDDLIARARLAVTEYEANLVGGGTLDTLSDAIARAGEASGTEGDFYLLDREDDLALGPVEGREALDTLTRRALPTGVPDGFTEVGTRPDRLVARERRRLSPSSELTQTAYHVLRDRPSLTNAHVDRAFVRENTEGEQEVVLEIVPEGEERSSRQTLAAILDRQLIDHRAVPGGTVEDRLVLSTESLTTDPERLAIQLGLDPLPLQVEVVERR